MTPPLAPLQRALGAARTIERELGARGIAMVYLAHDVEHDRDVAIKVLHPDLGVSPGAGGVAPASTAGTIGATIIVPWAATGRAVNRAA